MGYYIETSNHHGKAEEIAKKFNGKVVSLSEAMDAVSDAAKGVICVVNNGPFEAAGFAYDLGEFKEFTRPDDRHPKKFVVISRKDATTASGYAR